MKLKTDSKNLPAFTGSIGFVFSSLEFGKQSVEKLLTVDIKYKCCFKF